MNQTPEDKTTRLSKEYCYTSEDMARERAYTTPAEWARTELIMLQGGVRI